MIDHPEDPSHYIKSGQVMSFEQLDQLKLHEGAKIRRHAERRFIDPSNLAMSYMAKSQVTDDVMGEQIDLLRAEKGLDKMSRDHDKIRIQRR